ncbi:hypothetical protein [Mesorhizobium sp. M0088]|uniref:hypothetical protein n=1 Tax=Mesorhizobium sp. M0088 TaxID=2956873 RepID=UPI003335FC98
MRRLDLAIDKNDGAAVLEADLICEMKSLTDGGVRIHRRCGVFDNAANPSRIDDRAVLPD